MTGPRPKLLQSKLASTLDTSKPLTLCSVRSDFALPFQHVCAFTTNHPKLQACPQYPRGKFPRVTHTASSLQGHKATRGDPLRPHGSNLKRS